MNTLDRVTLGFTGPPRQARAPDWQMRFPAGHQYVKAIPALIWFRVNGWIKPGSDEVNSV